MKRQPRKSLIPYAIGTIGLLLVAEYIGFLSPSLAFLLIVIALGIGALRSTREKEHPARHGWSLAGTVLAAIAAVGGLAVLAMAVVLFVALSSGNFKFGNK